MKSGILQDALRNSGARVAAVVEPVAPAKAAAPKAAAAPRAKAAVAPSRADTKSFTVHLPEAVRRQVKMMAVEQNRTMDDLVAEGLNLLFVKHRKPEIAPRKGSKAA